MIHDFHILPRYAETDMMGIIHHAVYPIWIEAARLQLIKDTGMPYSEIESLGIMLPVTELALIYKHPVFYTNNVLIKSAITELKNRKIQLNYQIFQEDILCSIGFSKHIFMNKNSRKSMRISSNILDLFRLFYDPEFQKIE